MKKILVYSDKNSARSPMLQGWLSYFLKDKAEIYSAGDHIESIHRLAQKAMMESVIDINNYQSKNTEDYSTAFFDYVIIVDHTKPEDVSLNINPGQIISHPFSNPRLAEGSEEERLEAYREVCKEIEDYAMEFAMKQFNLAHYE
jgi:arsenate reductase